MSKKTIKKYRSLLAPHAAFFAQRAWRFAKVRKRYSQPSYPPRGG